MNESLKLTVRFTPNPDGTPLWEWTVYVAGKLVAGGYGATRADATNDGTVYLTEWTQANAR